MYIIVGLGNPGKKYENTRHNMGFIAVDLLAEKYGIKVDKIKFKALVGEGRIAGRKVLLVKPQFEVGKKSLSKKGIVTDKKAERNAIDEIKRHAQSIGFEIIGFTKAPKKEADKNQEYLLYLKKQSE